MEHMEGALHSLTGFDIDEMLGNRVTSWVGITHHDDVDRVFAEVDTAIERSEPWDVAYRIITRKKETVWVRERGCAVFEDGQMVYLQGLIVSAAAERLLSMKLEDLVTKTKTANKEIVALSSQITSSVKQLSMLSINARIEAARSGEAGLGFAVVADEMKTLAEENGRLAGHITEKINASEVT